MLPGGGLPLIDCNCNKPTWPTTHQGVVSFENAHTLAFETHFKTNAHISTSVESSFEKKKSNENYWLGRLFRCVGFPQGMVGDQPEKQGAEFPRGHQWHSKDAEPQ
eukprot:EG_transcript_21026